MKSKKALALVCAAALSVPAFAGHRGFGRTAGGLFLAGGILHAVAATADIVNHAAYGRPPVVVAPPVAPVVAAPVVTAPVATTAYATGYYPAATTTTVYTGAVLPPSYYGLPWYGYGSRYHTRPYRYSPAFRPAPLPPSGRFGGRGFGGRGPGGFGPGGFRRR